MKNFKLGKLPAISHMKQLVFSNYFKATTPPPDVFNYWARRKVFTPRMFSNDIYGDCTRASQAIAAMRMERIENNNAIDINIPDSEVERVYFDMTKKYYGGGDTGAYEIDALSCWRKPDSTFKDIKGHPYTIDAFTKVNQSNQVEVKNAISLSGAHGIKICLNLPLAWSTQEKVWDIPANQKPIGKYAPGSWGGHSLYCSGYDKEGLFLPTWDIMPKISWAAFAIYSDECYQIVDSINSWKKKKISKKVFDLDALKADVNAVSSQKIK